MAKISLFSFLGRSVAAAALTLSLSQAGATPTSLEVTGALFDGSGNRITAPFITFTHGIYNSASGGTLLAQLGPENVQVNNGSFLQVFGVEDALFETTAYLQVNLNGFDMGPRLGIFFNGSYFFASGVASGPADSPVFELYTGLSAPVPEPSTSALMLAGAALAGIAVACRKRTARSSANN
ncbi:PEP-CTERM sorting domain-containing protein [Roseateles sp.]|uniref:PEP-CTERM sorting domain-containing protein n=1 Tax=Roseateles sp. TaxID=1971397 RepID=UPI0032649002